MRGRGPLLTGASFPRQVGQDHSTTLGDSLGIIGQTCLVSVRTLDSKPMTITLMTRINDPVRLKLTRCKKRAILYSRVIEIGSGHKGNRY